jgi:hypothetical protein
MSQDFFRRCTLCDEYVFTRDFGDHLVGHNQAVVANLVPVRSDTIEGLYAWITLAAQLHGEASGPDHEVSDLQEALWDAMEMLKESQLISLRMGCTERISDAVGYEVTLPWREEYMAVIDSHLAARTNEGKE